MLIGVLGFGIFLAPVRAPLSAIALLSHPLKLEPIKQTC